MSITAPERARRRLQTERLKASGSTLQYRRDEVDLNVLAEWQNRMKEYEEDYWRNRLRGMI